jgi:type II secretory pathway component GspD/PulD (secretin)
MRVHHFVSLFFVSLGLVGMGWSAGDLRADEVSDAAAAPTSEPAVAVEAAPVSASDDDDAMIMLNFPPKTPLKALVEFACIRLGFNYVSDDASLERTFSLRTTTPIPRSALLGVVQAVLAEQDLTLADTDEPSLKRVVKVDKPDAMAAAARRVISDANPAATEMPATQVFVLRHVPPEKVQGALQALLSKKDGLITTVEGQGILMVTDQPGNLRRVAELIAAIDTDRMETIITVVPVRHGSAVQMHQNLQALEALKQGQRGAAGNLAFTAAESSNSIVIVGTEEMVQRVRDTIRDLDVPPNTQRHVYTPKLLPPEELDDIIQTQFTEDYLRSNYFSAVDAAHGSLIVSAPAGLHAQIGQLLAVLDLPVSEQETPVRFYKLTNTVAADVLDTLVALNLGGSSGGGAADQEPPPLLSRRDRTEAGDGGAGSRGGGGNSDGNNSNLTGDEGNADTRFGSGSQKRQRNTRERTASRRAMGGESRLASSLLTGSASAAETEGPVIAADENTNSIIVIAPPREQELFAQLIRQLDQRRPQVLIETTIVSLDTSDGFELGVDIGFASGEIVSFSSFGISSLNAKTGRLSPLKATGGTFAMLSPDVADVVVRALSSNSRARLVSMPRILVNDNELGTLNSISKEPFERVVTTDGGTTITGEGSTAEAGTRIEVTPHISLGGYLQLEYAVELSSFVGQRLPNLPPPSQENTMESRVTIPDGHTIVVGGLNRSDARQSNAAIPLLGDIPLLKHLFSSQSNTNTNTTLFVFIRPTILSDPRFDDLKHLSRIDVGTAQVEPDDPSSEPMLMEPTPTLPALP